MKYEKAKNEFLKNVAEAKYKYASDLLNLLDDDDVIEVYSNYNKIFSTLSGMSKEEILKDETLLCASIEVLEEYLDNRIDEEDFNEMDRDDQIELIVSALEDCDNLYSFYINLK